MKTLLRLLRAALRPPALTLALRPAELARDANPARRIVLGTSRILILHR